MTELEVIDPFQVMYFTRNILKFTFITSFTRLWVPPHHYTKKVYQAIMIVNMQDILERMDVS